MRRVEEEPLRVLHVVGSAAMAGVERHALGLVIELRRLGCTAELAYPPRAGPLREKARAAGVDACSSIRGRGDGTVQIVHSHDGRSALLATLLAATTRAVLVRTQHFVVPASASRSAWQSHLSVVTHRALNRRLDGYICVSHAVADAARTRRDVDGPPVAIIPPGVSLPGEEQLDEACSERERAARPMIVSATRLEPEARVDVLLEALPRILREFPECRVTIAGSGSLALPLKRRAELLGVSEAVTWTGWLAEISPLLAAGHIYVNARPLEGFGMATAEAMGFGLPVIAVNAGAGPELVQDGVTGRLVPPADSTALAEGVCELLRNLRRASAMGARGRERATAAFSMHATAVSTLAFYERLAEHRQDR